VVIVQGVPNAIFTKIYQKSCRQFSVKNSENFTKNYQKLWRLFTIQNRKECAEGEIFDDCHENLLECIEEIHYPKVKK